MVKYTHNSSGENEDCFTIWIRRFIIKVTMNTNNIYNIYKEAVLWQK